MYTGDPLSAMTTGLLLSLIVTLQLVGTPPVVGGVQVPVSWSTDVLVTVMFPTGPGEAGEEGGEEQEGCIGGWDHSYIIYHSLIIFTVSLPTTAPLLPSTHTTVVPFRASTAGMVRTDV